MEYSTLKPWQEIGETGIVMIRAVCMGDFTISAILEGPRGNNTVW